MTLQDIQTHLGALELLEFQLPSGQLVPRHFHVTEIGKVSKDFIDCGGTLRHETVINFQLWQANDYDHRLHPEKLTHIIELSKSALELPEDLTIEVEYQGDTIQKYGLDFDGTRFLLTTTQTDCLAKDQCGIPAEKPKIKLSDLNSNSACCSPNSGCC